MPSVDGPVLGGSFACWSRSRSWVHSSKRKRGTGKTKDLILYRNNSYAELNISSSPSFLPSFFHFLLISLLISLLFMDYLFICLFIYLFIYLFVSAVALIQSLATSFAIPFFFLSVFSLYVFLSKKFQLPLQVTASLYTNHFRSKFVKCQTVWLNIIIKIKK